MAGNHFEIRPIKFNKELNKFLLKIKKDLGSFFKIKIKDPKIFLLNSREGIDAVCGRRTEDWFVGWTNNNNSIFILEESVFPKESSHKDKRYFWKVLKHEYCHLYFRQLTKNHYPIWLNEGLACFLAEQEKEGISKKQALKVFDYYDKGGKGVYGVSYFWVKLLINSFGKEKLMELLKAMVAIKTKEEFATKFFETYGVRYGKNSFAKIINASISLSQVKI